MKIVFKDLKRGVVKVVPETTDDIWTLYTVIQPGDLVRARTVREVHFGERGSGRSSRVPMTLTIRVEKTEFQAFTTRLRIRGLVVEGPEKYGVLGKYHTINIDVGRELEIMKPHGWPRALLEKLESSSLQPAAVIVAVDYDEYAVAIARGQGVRVLAEGGLHLPGKDDPSREEKMREALTIIAKTTAGIVEREKPLLVVVAGPGMLKDALAERLRTLLPREVRLYVDHVSMGGHAGILEEVRRGVMRNALREAASIRAEKFIEEFEKLLAKEPCRVAYTIDMVTEAARMGAVGKLLVLDELLHHPDPEVRKRVDELLRLADMTRPEIQFISTEAPAGAKVKSLGGVVAILRYALQLQGKACN